jgi:5-formyltetrahydrofolate cyclo-ligase
MEKRAEKSALRARFRAYRASLTDEAYRLHSDAICSRVDSLAEVRQARRVHVYWPLTDGHEIDTRPLISRLAASGCEVVLPVVETWTGEPRLRHVLFEEEHTLRRNHWGILEPVETDPVEPESLDLVVVPALGAGRNFHRIGHGRGYYDVFLRQIDAPTVCVVYDACLVDAIPAEPHDVPVRVIVTETAVIRR